MKVKRNLENAAGEARFRITKRKREEEAALLEAYRKATDPFLSTLPEKLEEATRKKVPVRYEVPDNEYQYDKASRKFVALGATAYLQKECREFGLKAELSVHHDSKGYVSYEWAYLEISK